MTADRSAAADTLRDELAEALWRHWADADNEHGVDWSIVPDDEKHTWRGYAGVVLRWADARVAAERERIAAVLREKAAIRLRPPTSAEDREFGLGLMEAARAARGQP